MSYGQEFVLDLYGCSIEKFNRDGITQFMKELCDLIQMERCDLHFWDYEGYPEEKENAPAHLDGTSAIQFIKTSNITIHTLDKVGEVMINVFSCKNFNHGKVRYFAMQFFKANDSDETCIVRGSKSKV